MPHYIFPNYGFCPPGRGPGPPQAGPQDPPGPRRVIFSDGAPTKWPPGQNYECIPSSAPLRSTSSGRFLLRSPRFSQRKGIAKRFVGQVVFWRPGVPMPKKRHIQKRVDDGPCRLRRRGQKSTRFWKRVVFLALVPQAYKKTLGQTKTFRDPFDQHADSRGDYMQALPASFSCVVSFRVGPEIVDVGPLPGQPGPGGGLGKGTGRGPARFAPIFSPVDQF